MHLSFFRCLLIFWNCSLQEFIRLFYLTNSNYLANLRADASHATPSTGSVFGLPPACSHLNVITRASSHKYNFRVTCEWPEKTIGPKMMINLQLLRHKLFCISLAIAFTPSVDVGSLWMDRGYAEKLEYMLLMTFKTANVWLPWVDRYLIPVNAPNMTFVTTDQGKTLRVNSHFSKLTPPTTICPYHL